MKLKLSVSNCPDSQAGTLQPIALLWVQWWCFCCTWHCVCTENPSRAWAFEECCLQGLFTLDSVQDARHDVSWQKQKDSSPTQIVPLSKHLAGWVLTWGWSGRPQENLKRHGHLTPSALRERPLTASKEASRQVSWGSCDQRRFPQSSHGYLAAVTSCSYLLFWSQDLIQECCHPESWREGTVQPYYRAFSTQVCVCGGSSFFKRRRECSYESKHQLNVQLALFTRPTEACLIYRIKVITTIPTPTTDSGVLTLTPRTQFRVLSPSAVIIVTAMWVPPTSLAREEVCLGL